jgi:hypothetical protein
MVNPVAARNREKIAEFESDQQNSRCAGGQKRSKQEKMLIMTRLTA